MTYSCTIETPLGAAMAAAEGDALTGFWFIGQKYYPAAASGWEERPDLPVFAALRSWLKSYFAAEKPSLDIPLAPRGTEFQRAVWDALVRIPRGQVTTYGEIARELAKSRGTSAMSAQAVGGAVGHNPISVLIPCHRVVGSTGSLTGYAGGLEKKEALLSLEGADVSAVRGSSMPDAARQFAASMRTGFAAEQRRK